MKISGTRTMSQLTLWLLVWVLLPPAWAQPAGDLKILVNPGDTGEQSRAAVYGAWKAAMEPVLRKQGLGAAQILMSSDTTADLGATRARLHAVYVAPAHVIGSAVRYGYKPVLGLEQTEQAVLVAPKSSPVGNFAQAAGKRLGLPAQDSVVTYLLRGEVNAANTTIKRHFGALYETRYQEALLHCLQLHRCDVVAVDRSVYERWVANGAELKVLLESRPVPGLSVAVRNDVKFDAAALREPLSGAQIRTTTVKAADFDYVSTLGYFTPRELPGAQVIDAARAAQLMDAGALYVDTRTEAEFKAGHAPGAKLVPYVEKSAKDADYEGGQDQFDLKQLPAEREVELIFACNGAECWKSYKASHAALKAGYKKVYWFRGGFPEWRASGRKVATGG